jgi:RsiW-degrading membrane proteinase PrsW (M82 family)
MSGRDPIQRVAERGRDLYDVATWEQRTPLDAVVVRLHGALVSTGRVAVVGFAALIVVSQVALAAAATLDRPVVGVYILLSVVPALLLVVFVWRADVTASEPLDLLVGTFLLGLLFAGFAAVVNSSLMGVFGAFLPPVLAFPLFFFLVVGPVEETVKWLAVRLYAFRSDRFAAVVDGAVYGAVAGLGFATIENSIYIAQQYLTTAAVADGALIDAARTAALRSFAGPGHVIYSAFAGYYLGLAKFNRERAGPIVVKGLLVAALIHATYNTAVTVGLPLALSAPPLAAVGQGPLFLLFVVVFDGVFGYVLYRKIARYRRVYEDVGAADADAVGAVERTEFE